MPNAPVPKVDDLKAIKVTAGRGKQFDAIRAYQTDNGLNVIVSFKDETELQLHFDIALTASATLHDCRDGDLHVLRTITPRIVRA
jgi:hypothetical protein